MLYVSDNMSPVPSLTIWHQSNVVVFFNISTAQMKKPRQNINLLRIPHLITVELRWRPRHSGIGVDTIPENNPMRRCSGLNENGPVGSYIWMQCTIWEGLGCVVLWEEVWCWEWALRFQKPMLGPVCHACCRVHCCDNGLNVWACEQALS